MVMEYILLFADLQLDVKGCKDVYESFDKYVEVERLEGENKYHAEQFGLQVYIVLLMLTFVTIPAYNHFNFCREFVSCHSMHVSL